MGYYYHLILVFVSLLMAPFFIQCYSLLLIKYGEAVKLSKERDKEEIRKVIVQKIPHLNDGRLLFEPDEGC